MYYSIKIYFRKPRWNVSNRKKHYCLRNIINFILWRLKDYKKAISRNVQGKLSLIHENVKKNNPEEIHFKITFFSRRLRKQNFIDKLLRQIGFMFVMVDYLCKLYRPSREVYKVKRKDGKLLMVRLPSATWIRSQHLSCTSFESKTSQPLVRLNWISQYKYYAGTFQWMQLPHILLFFYIPSFKLKDINLYFSFLF